LQAYINAWVTYHTNYPPLGCGGHNHVTREVSFKKNVFVYIFIGGDILNKKVKVNIFRI